MAACTKLKLRLNVIIEVSDYELSHGGIVSRYRIRFYRYFLIFLYPSASSGAEAPTISTSVR
jgi:hypothetical protein